MTGAMKQLEEWVNGNPIHNAERNECCPDFSCCNKKMNTSKEVKDRFMKAVLAKDDKTQLRLLGNFLREAMFTKGKKVYIAGLND